MFESDAVREAWVDRNQFTVQRFNLFRAIRALAKHSPMEAIALIRASFTTEEEGWTSLKDARILLGMIMAADDIARRLK
jgi:hypothetical protein